MSEPLSLKQRALTRRVLAAIIWGLLWASVSAATPPEKGSSRPVPVPLRLPIEGAISTIDPGLTQDTASIEITEQLFLGLTDFDPHTYAAVPELARSWSVSADGRTYCFQLRQDVTWTDGTPVTAHDVVRAIRRNIKPETRSPYVSALYILENAEAIHTGLIRDLTRLGVQAPDDFTVEFRLSHPASYFPAMAGLWVYRPLPREALETYGERWTDPGHIRTNGSYMLSAWHKGKRLILRKNPAYYGAGEVTIPEVHYVIVPESHAGLIMYQNNDLDLMGGPYLRLPPTELPNIRADAMLEKEYFREPHFCSYFYGFNTKRPPVDNPLVRRAISAAIDRQLIIQVITMGEEEAAFTITRPPIFGAVDPSEGIGIRFDPGLAKKWLAQAGYPDGAGFPELTLMYNASETHAKIARGIQTLLNYHLNIRVRLRELTWEAFVAELERQDKAHIFKLGWCADYPDANNWLNENFHPSKSANRIGWENEEFARLMDHALAESDPEKRKNFYRRAEEILTEEACGVIPLYFETARYLVKPRISGWYHMAMGGQHIRNWAFRDEPVRENMGVMPEPDRLNQAVSPGTEPASPPISPHTISGGKFRMFGTWFAKTYYGNTLLQWASALFLIFLALIIGRIIYWVFGTVLKKLTAKTETRLDDILIDMIEEPMVFVGVVAAVWFSLSILTVHEKIQVWIDRIFYFLIIFNIAWLISRTVDALVDHYIMPLAEKTETDLDDIIIPLARSLFRFVVWILALVVALNNAGYDIGAIIAGLGIGGLAVALAAKDTLVNLMGGVTIVMSRIFTVGDLIVINACKNPLIVREIGLRSTRLQDAFTDNLITMPNSFFSDRPVENMSAHAGYWWFNSVNLPNDTAREKVDLVLQLIQSIIGEHEKIDRGNAMLKTFELYSLQISFYFYVRRYEDRLSVRDEVNREILSALQKNHIDFFRFKSLPPNLVNQGG